MSSEKNMILTLKYVLMYLHNMYYIDSIILYSIYKETIAAVYMTYFIMGL